MFCSKCGKEINDDSIFCEQCGCRVKKETVEEIDNEEAPVVESKEVHCNTCAKKSYIASIISVIASLIIRLSIQENHIYYDSILDNTKVLGIDRDLKPLFTLIPGIAAIIAALLLSVDKVTNSQKKRTILIINAVYILLSVIFIWLDIPSNIIDF